MERLHSPSPDHAEFDQICAEVEEFEPLPTVRTAILEPEDEIEDDGSVDRQILAGLVSPV